MVCSDKTLSGDFLQPCVHVFASQEIGCREAACATPCRMAKVASSSLAIPSKSLQLVTLMIWKKCWPQNFVHFALEHQKRRDKDWAQQTFLQSVLWVHGLHSCPILCPNVQTWCFDYTNLAFGFASNARGNQEGETQQGVVRCRWAGHLQPAGQLGCFLPVSTALSLDWHLQSKSTGGAVDCASNFFASCNGFNDPPVRV